MAYSVYNSICWSTVSSFNYSPFIAIRPDAIIGQSTTVGLSRKISAASSRVAYTLGSCISQHIDVLTFELWAARKYSNTHAVASNILSTDKHVQLAGNKLSPHVLSCDWLKHAHFYSECGPLEFLSDQFSGLFRPPFSVGHSPTHHGRVNFMQSDGY